MSTTIRLNTKLLKLLSEVIFVSSTVIRNRAGIARTTWYTLMEKPEGLNIQQLLAISNSMHIPVRRFFSKGKADLIGKRDDYIMEPYKECSYRGEVLQEIIEKNKDATWKKASDATGITYDNLRKSLLGDRKTPVDRFLAACEALSIDPFLILVDPNPEVDKKDKTNINKLRQEIQALTATVADLKEKHKVLLDRHNRLENFIREYLGDNIGMAAEPEPGEK